ncbi:MAG: hypothetical protein HC769_04490 [Cyanobacteria bacterium CRU_2_1]|nr:hypothetical protein [Cyanobacteria bacterium RU_5_0]NJR58172.1 hypothetical protein [Cyanobacteria bacterium CRU_2_1]
MNTDNQLKGAINLGGLGASPLTRSNRIGLTDRDDLYRFSLKEHSRFDLAATNIAKGADLNVELYALKRPWNQVIRQIGTLDFSQIRRINRNINLQRVSSSRRSRNRNETLAIDSLAPGEYICRVLRQRGNSRYRLNMRATAIVQPIDNENDTEAPTASLSTTGITTENSNPYDFSVTYSDNTAINRDSLDNSDIQVTGVNGFSQFATRVAVNAGSNDKSLIVSYRITPPGGRWDEADNGIYTVSLQSNQVSDTNNNFAAAKGLGTFEVSINKADTIAPTATLAAPNLSTGGITPYEFTVTYSDNIAVNVGTIDSRDIQVTGANGFSQLATFVQVNDNRNGSPRMATYRITAPDGTWDNADNGTYRISLQDNSVNDTSNNPLAAGLLGTFQVNIAAPRRALRFSGNSNGPIQTLQLDLNTLDQDEDPDPNRGLFRGAIENFNATITTETGSEETVSFGAADIESFQFDRNLIYNFFNGDDKFSAPMVAYRVEFSRSYSDHRSSDPREPSVLNTLTFFVKSNDPNSLVNSLMSLEQISFDGDGGGNYATFLGDRNGRTVTSDDGEELFSPGYTLFVSPPTDLP